ncbi:hypothetical protein [Mastigocladopsis repens]|nr:hypothetical protein [Mastigocladopsis repens]
MEASGSSSSQTTIEESIVSDEDPDQSSCRGQLTNSVMNLPLLALI